MGLVSTDLVFHVLWLLVFILIIFPLPQYLMHRRLIK